jgi:enamine deaminase RidA (YjgF/YER057c/UK114 family)
MDTESLPFSPARAVGGWVFLSGQGGFIPESGELAGDSIDEQTEQTLRNVAALLEQHDCTLANVVSCLVHLSDHHRDRSRARRNSPRCAPLRVRRPEGRTESLAPTSALSRALVRKVQTF